MYRNSRSGLSLIAFATCFLCGSVVFGRPAPVSSKDEHVQRTGSVKTGEAADKPRAPVRDGNGSMDTTQSDHHLPKLKYQFPLKFVKGAHPERSIVGPGLLSVFEKLGPGFKVFSSKPKGAIESFRYFLRYDLYPVKTFDGRHKLFLLVASSRGLSGTVEAILLDDAANGHRMLDYISLDPRNDNKFGFLKLGGHGIISLRQSIHGTGYLDEQEALIGIIGKKFHNLFSTDLLQANDWDISDSANPNLFDRWLAKIEYVDEKGYSLPDIRKEVSEDIVNLSPDSATFRNAPITKHIRSWVEVYNWDKKTDAYVLDKKLSKAGNDGIGKP